MGLCAPARPLVWTALALFAARDGSAPRGLFASGLLLLAGLLVFYGLGLLSAGRMPMLMVPPP